MILRTACRFSFKERAPGITSVSLRTPTTICALPPAARRQPPADSGQARPDRLQLVRLDDVAFLEVVEVLDADAALESLVDFLHVVLEAPQGGDLPGEDRLRVAQ